MHVIYLVGTIDFKPLLSSYASSLETYFVYFILNKLCSIKIYLEKYKSLRLKHEDEELKKYAKPGKCLWSSHSPRIKNRKKTKP